MEKTLDGNYTRMLWAILNKSWRQQSTKQQLYGHLPPFTKTIQIRRTRHVGHCLRSKDELISNVLLWTPSQAKAGWPARTYIQQLCADTECSLEDLPGAMNDRDRWWERVREIYAGSSTWWWGYLLCYTIENYFIFFFLNVFFFSVFLKAPWWVTRTWLVSFDFVHQDKAVMNKIKIMLSNFFSFAK